MRASPLIFFILFISAISYADTKFNFDVYERVRYENIGHIYRDALGLNEQHYLRFKTSLGAGINAGNFSAYAKLTNENRTFIYRSAGDAGYNIDEVVIDNLYAEYKVGGLGIKAGRMDLLGEYGEGFLIADGTPEDGSRTYYFNAAKFSLHNDKSSLDIIGITNPKTDYLPVINAADTDKMLNYGGETAIAVIAKTELNKNIRAEPYYIYKTESVSNKMLPEESALNTAGAFVKFDYPCFAVRLQAAGQFGKYDDNKTRNALGAYGFVDVKDKLIFKKITFGGVYLSGDKQDDKTITGWDPLFSRYPWFSDLVCYTFVDENGAGYWSNLQAYTASVNIDILKNLGAFLSYNILYANENAAGTHFADGLHRGNLAQCKFDWRVSKYVNAVLAFEYMRRGSFYAVNDDIMYARVETAVKI